MVATALRTLFTPFHRLHFFTFSPRVPVSVYPLLIAKNQIRGFLKKFLQ